MEISGKLHAAATLPPGKFPRYPLVKRLGGPWSRSGGGGEEKKILFHLKHLARYLRNEIYKK